MKLVKTTQSHKVAGNRKNWKCIFSSFSVEVWEDINRHKKDTPIRFGLNDREKGKLLSIARNTIRHFLSTGSVVVGDSLNYNEGRLLEHGKYTVNVTLWFNGVVCGSTTHTEKNLCDAVIWAAVKTCKDFHYKPFNNTDFENIRIQISVFSDLRLPLLRQERKGNSVNTQNGHMIVYKDRIGFYPPLVFNTLRFSNSTQFFQSLAIGKAGIHMSKFFDATLLTFSVDDFIESVNKKHRISLSLRGPIVRAGSLSEKLKLSYVDMFNGVADWLMHIQQDDGYIPAALSPHSNKKTHSWPKMLFTAYALGEFGATAGKVTHRRAALKVFDYAYKTFPKITTEGSTEETLSFTYLGQLALTLGKKEVAINCVEKIKNNLHRSEINPSLLNQTAAFFFNVADVIGDPSFGLIAHSISEKIVKDLDNKIDSDGTVSLNNYAESVHLLFQKMPSKEGDFTKDTYEKVTTWFLNLQNDDGSFPTTQHDKGTHTRETSKIFEALAGDKENKMACVKALNWLHSMQYNDDNSFFIPSDRLEDFVGGFRHNSQDYDTWIDTAGHVLLGASRFRE